MANKISLIVPMSDILAGWLSENQGVIQSRTSARCAVSDYAVFQRASSKSMLMDLCRENGIPIPRTVRITDGNLEAVCALVGFPALIKPDHSVGARGITRVNNSEEFRYRYPAISAKYGSCSLQEFVDNPDFYYNVMLYRYEDGSYAQDVITKIFRFYPLSGGSSCCCVTIELPELSEICKKTLDLLEWEGFADFDVLYDIRELQYKIIEINPRVPASLRAAAVSGVDFPQIMVCDKLGWPKPVMKYQTGVYLRYLGLDTMWFLKSNKRFSSSPSWFEFFGNDLFYQDLYSEDFRMSVYSIFEGVKKLFKNR